MSALTLYIIPLPQVPSLNLNKAYCRESGVRNLKKHIEKIYRKVAYKVGLYTATLRQFNSQYLDRLFTIKRAD